MSVREGLGLEVVSRQTGRDHFVGVLCVRPWYEVDCPQSAVMSITARTSSKDKLSAAKILEHGCATRDYHFHPAKVERVDVSRQKLHRQVL